MKTLCGLSLALVACTAVDPVGEQNQGIIGGAKDTGDPSVVLVLAQDNQGSSLCTGEVVSPHVVLTAAHCVDPATVGNNETFYIFIGNDLNDQAQANNNANFINVKETHFDAKFSPNQLSSGHDVGVVITATAMNLPSLPMNHDAITKNDVGATLRLVGYGVDSGNDQQGTSAGTKRQVQTTLTSYNSLLLDFGDAQHNTCEGDSGGPAFLKVNGVELIAGITSFGDQGCVQGGYDTRVDVYAAAFVDPYIMANDPPQMMGMNPPPDMAQAKMGAVDLAMNQPPPHFDASVGGAKDFGMKKSGGADGGANNGQLGGTGSVCLTNDECQSGACALEGPNGFCTQACDPGVANECPVGFVCGTIGSDPFCVPAAASSRVGCNLDPHASPSLSGLVCALGLLALELLRQRRRRGVARS